MGVGDFSKDLQVVVVFSFQSRHNLLLPAPVRCGNCVTPHQDMKFQQVWLECESLYLRCTVDGHCVALT